MRYTGGIDHCGNLHPICACSNDTEEHSDRIIKLSIELVSALGLSDEQLLELDLLS